MGDSTLRHALLETLSGMYVVFTATQCWGSGTGSTCFWAIRIHYSEVRIRILHLSRKGVEQNEIILAKLNFNTKFKNKFLFLWLKIMCLRVSYKTKIWINNFFSILKVTKERSWILSCILWILIQHFRSMRTLIWFRIQAFDDQKIV